MLKIYPEKLVKHWGMLRAFIEKTLPPTADPEARANAILDSLLTGRMDAFQFVDMTDEANIMKGFVILAVVSSVDGYGRDLLIYSAYSYQAETLGKEALLEAWNLMVKYAQSKSCAAITAYTNIDHMINLAAGFGAETSYRYIRKEV